MVLKRINADLMFECGTTSTVQACRFAIISKPISEGVPVAVDLDNEKYSKWQHQCYATRDDVSGWIHDDFVHFMEILKIVVELGWDIYFSVVNGGTQSNTFQFLVRLFVKYI